MIETQSTSHFDYGHARTTLPGNLNVSQQPAVHLLPNRLPALVATASASQRETCNVQILDSETLATRRREELVNALLL